MSATITNQNLIQQNMLLTNYLPAVVRDYASGSRIEYWVEDPATRQLVRKRIRLHKIVSRFSTKKDAKRHVDAMVRSINLRLASGWNPCVTDSTDTGRSTVAVVSTASVSAPLVEMRPYVPVPTQPLFVEQNVSATSVAETGATVETATPEPQRENISVLAPSSRNFTPFKIVAERYFADCERSKRPDSLRSISSFLKIFGEWLDEHHPHISSGEISKEMVVRFMEYVEFERKGHDGKTCSSTYNNYRKCGGAFFTWMVEKCYCEENHFHKVKAKKNEDKIRILIPEQERQRISEYLAVKNPHYLLFLKMIYYALIRPKELSMLKVGNLSFAEKQLTVPKEVAKNHHERKVPLPDELLLDFIELGIGSARSDHYLFGEGFKAGETPLTKKVIVSTWSRMRDKLMLPKEMQTYSLRDTGITDMIKSGIDPLTVQQLADHSSLDVTSIYTRHNDPKLRERLSAKMPSFNARTDE